jgi:hypothetical protein
MVIHDVGAAVVAGGEGLMANGNDAENSVKPGMECDIKNLYQGPEDNRGRFTWTDKYPENLEKAAEDEVTARFAILIRHKKCFTDSRKTLEIDSIVVQSPLLKTMLGTVLADYPGKLFWLLRFPSYPLTLSRCNNYARASHICSAFQAICASMGGIHNSSHRDGR